MLYGQDNPVDGAVLQVILRKAESIRKELGVLVPLSRSLALSLQAATGFRAPPYFDVNVGISNLPLGYAVIPNPRLEPETSRGFEAGLRGRYGSLRRTPPSPAGW